VAVIVGGQPTKLLVDMKPEARALIKLLKFDANRPESKAALQTYWRDQRARRSYPNLLAEDVPSVAVRAYLVTYDYKVTSRQPPEALRPGRCARTSRSCRPRATRSGATSN
jgi:hypothetical protein